MWLRLLSIYFSDWIFSLLVSISVAYHILLKWVLLCVSNRFWSPLLEDQSASLHSINSAGYEDLKVVYIAQTRKKRGGQNTLFPRMGLVTFAISKPPIPYHQLPFTPMQRETYEGYRRFSEGVVTLLNRVSPTSGFRPLNRYTRMAIAGHIEQWR